MGLVQDETRRGRGRKMTKYELKEKFYSWLAWKLPRELVMWAAIRLGANATQGKWGHTVVPELTFMDALQRWE